MGDRSFSLRGIFEHGDSAVSLSHIASYFRLPVKPFGHEHATSIMAPLRSFTFGNPTLAQQMYRGHFCFGNESITLKTDAVFSWQSDNQTALRARDNLSWLKHFAAANHKLHANFARHLLSAWANERLLKLSELELAEAILAISQHGTKLWSEALADEQEKLLKLVSSAAAKSASRPSHIATTRFSQAMALMAVGVSFGGLTKTLAVGLNWFDQSIDQVIMKDGGHVSRDPNDVLALLQILIPLRASFISLRKPIPNRLQTAIETMVPMLRMMCHGDHDFACFHGATPQRAAIANVLENVESVGRPLQHAQSSGLARLTGGISVLLADTASGSTFNSALAIEFSEGRNRILSNCGFPSWGNPIWQSSARSASAHNTLVFDGKNPEVFSKPAEVLENASGSLLKMTSAIGDKTHTRTCFLAKNGRDLRVNEVITGENATFTMRLHLHPDVKVSTVRNGTELIISLSGKSAWRFLLRGADFKIEDSISLASPDGPRKTNQIVIRGIATSTGVAVDWSLKKTIKVPKSSSTTADDKELPLLLI